MLVRVRGETAAGAREKKNYDDNNNTFIIYSAFLIPKVALQCHKHTQNKTTTQIERK